MTTLLEEVLKDYMHTRGFKLATAESCTGGLVSHRITNISGSSEYYPGGVVAYSYEAKASMLGVTWDTLNTHGAVSEETVLEMARGARKLFDADIAISVSGIAGPTGGTMKSRLVQPGSDFPQMTENGRVILFGMEIASRTNITHRRLPCNSSLIIWKGS